MKPISVELQAFGPFAGREKIDFESLSSDGLFLIRGKTGSGKSMIIDAISFALFGKSSGENRDNLEDLRCNRCNPNMDTFVRFTFEEKGRVYVFERLLRKARKNLSSKANAYVINSDGNWEPLFENPKEKEVTGKAEEIIGLSFDQFRQVIILPQGKFEKLLTSRSEDKEKILSSIFGTEKWQAMADSYYNRAKAEKDRLNEIKSRIDSRLEDEGCNSIEELRKKAEAVEAAREEEEKIFREQDYDRREEKLNEKKAVCGEFDMLQRYIKRKYELDSKSDSVEAERRKLEMAEKAEPFRKILEERNKAFDEFNMRKNDEEKAVTSRKQAEKALEEAETNLSNHNKKKAEYEKWKKDRIDFESKKPLYESLGKASETLRNAERKHKDAEIKLADIQKEYDKNRVETGELYKGYEETLAKRKAAMDSYMRGICGNLASELEEGQVCPVCGSREHPDKALIPEGTATMEYVDTLEQTENQKKENWSRAKENLIESEKKLEEKKTEEMQIKSEYDVASAEYNRIKEGLADGINSMEDLENMLRKLKYSICEYEYDGKQVEEAMQNAALSLRGAQANCENASNERDKAEKQYLNAEETCETMIADSVFETTREAENAMIDREERNRIANDAGEYDGQVMEINKLIEGKKSQLEGVDEPDIIRIESELEKIGEEKTAFNKSQGAFIKEIERLNAKISNLDNELKTFESEIQTVESDFIFAKSLRGDTGIGLQRYVLGIMFSSVIAAANEMLEKVHGGRYRLYRTDEKVAGSNKKGLDLKVHDSYSGGADGRSVSTLSGGEKFLASLALSLGMSSVARSGGVHIEGMFIDEGFGTLDENSVEDALDVLRSIRQLNGSVGIISHMDVLGANIPSQIIVEKEKETSTIRLV